MLTILNAADRAFHGGASIEGAAVGGVAVTSSSFPLVLSIFRSYCVCFVVAWCFVCSSFLVDFECMKVRLIRFFSFQVIVVMCWNLYLWVKVCVCWRFKNGLLMVFWRWGLWDWIDECFCEGWICVCVCVCEGRSNTRENGERILNFSKLYLFLFCVFFFYMELWLIENGEPLNDYEGFKEIIFCVLMLIGLCVSVEVTMVYVYNHGFVIGRIWVSVKVDVNDL